jgi:hypothetical protein
LSDTPGVSLNGLGATGGTNGIVFNSGGSLTVIDCVAQNFAYTGSGLVTGNGIFMQPTAGATTFVITNTIASNNGHTGIYYFPPGGSTATANGVIDHVVATNNGGQGIAIVTEIGGGAARVAVSNSIASHNSDIGVFFANVSAPLAGSIDNTTASSNAAGFTVGGTANVSLGRSLATANGVGADNATSPNTFYSYSDNRLNGNNSDIGGTGLNTHGLQ